VSASLSVEDSSVASMTNHAGQNRAHNWVRNVRSVHMMRVRKNHRKLTKEQCSLWEEKNLVSSSSQDPRYTGRFGSAALSAIQGSFMGTPAVQDTGGEGTALCVSCDVIL